MTYLSPSVTGYIAAGAVAGTAAWWRADPATFDRWMAPRLRSVRRRWGAYIGRRWTNIMTACDLVKERKDGQVDIPRLVRVTAVTPSIDVLTVQFVRGQSVRKFQEVHEELAAALNVESVSINRVPKKPRQLRIVGIRSNPFEHAIEPADIPEDAEQVDLKALEIGEDELGNDVTIPWLGEHLLVVGRMGSGKSSLIWNPLRAAGPAIRDGLVELSGIDPKGGMELGKAQSLFRSYCDEPDKIVPALKDFRDRMRHRQEQLKAVGARKVTISDETPLNVLIIDELAMLTAYGADTKEVQKLLAEVLTQGRACGFVVCAYLQEPTKDVNPLRDLFTRRVCLGVTRDSHVDMALGEGMRDRGALADQIPGGEDHAGIGFLVAADFKVTGKGKVKYHTPGAPMRIRCGETSDEDIDELVKDCTPNFGADVVQLADHDRRPSINELPLDPDGDGEQFSDAELAEFSSDSRSGRAVMPDDMAVPF